MINTLCGFNGRCSRRIDCARRLLPNSGIPGSQRTSRYVQRWSILEHSRIFYFHANGERKTFLASAD